MNLTHAVATLGRGPGRSRSLTAAEAEAAMAEVLGGDAPAEAVGALLMLLRMKGETADEIAGFVRAARQSLPAGPIPDLDWPVYAAGRTRGLPWFLHAAKVVSAAGHRVLLHGRTPDARITGDGFRAAGIPVVTDARAADQALTRHGIAFWPLDALSPDLTRLLGLREVLGLRSCINTCLRVLNPFHARASVQGVFHPSYRTLQADAGQRLGQEALTVIKGGGGEFERHPSKRIEAFGLRGGTPWQADFPPLLGDTRRMADPGEAPELLFKTNPGPWADAVVTGTAALALETLGHRDAAEVAEAIWATRRRATAA